MLNDVIKFKVHVQTSLEGYEDFVAQEVDRECEEQELAELEERRLADEEMALFDGGVADVENDDENGDGDENVDENADGDGDAEMDHTHDEMDDTFQE